MTHKRRSKAQLGKFRDTSRFVSDDARTPNDDVSKNNPHVLASGRHLENLIPSLREPGGAIDFFDQRRIKWWTSPKSGDQKGQRGPTRNLASSQVACVNFLMPLRHHPEVLTELLRGIDADVEGVFPIKYRTPSGEVRSFVDFEWVGLRTSLEGTTPTRGANCTSADALMIAKTLAGNRAYLFEWKVIESYNPDADLGKGRSGNIRKERYTELYDDPTSPFNQSVPLEDLLYEPLYQAMRLVLLGEKMVREKELNASSYRVVFVSPESNTAYRQTITSPALRKHCSETASWIGAFQSLLKSPGTVRSVCQEDLLRSVPELSTLAEWREYQTSRYP